MSASGFVPVVGRPNVGKSTLVNALVGEKVAITSPRPQTTRNTIRGVLTTDDAQFVFIDTPGLHKPRNALGTRLNSLVEGSIADADAVLFVLDATGPIGPGDRRIAERLREAGTPVVVVVNKVDAARHEETIAQLDPSDRLYLLASQRSTHRTIDHERPALTGARAVEGDSGLAVLAVLEDRGQLGVGVHGRCLPVVLWWLFSSSQPPRGALRGGLGGHAEIPSARNRALVGIHRILHPVVAFEVRHLVPALDSSIEGFLARHVVVVARVVHRQQGGARDHA